MRRCKTASRLYQTFIMVILEYFKSADFKRRDNKQMKDLRSFKNFVSLDQRHIERNISITLP